MNLNNFNPININNEHDNSSYLVVSETTGKPILQQLSLTHPNAPTLSRAVTPFHQQRSNKNNNNNNNNRNNTKSAARVAALFYSQCYLEGISSVDADAAALESQVVYRSWWEQERFVSKQQLEDGDDDLDEEYNQTDSNDLSSSNDNEHNDLIIFRQFLRKRRRLSEIIHLFDSSYANESDLEEDNNLEKTKALLLQALVSSNGDVTSEPFLTHCLHLIKSVPSTELPSVLPSGAWVTLSKPHFPECLGVNEKGEFMYTLGRMSFDMFRPAHLKCTIQGIFSVFGDATVSSVAIPWNIRKAINPEKIRTYNISIAFTIEAPTGPLRAVLINHGYVVPHPTISRRYSVWFTHGTLEEDPAVNSSTCDENGMNSSSNNNNGPSSDWKILFGGDLPRRNMSEKARILAAQILLGATVPQGMSEDGTMEYRFKRSIGGYNDVLYVDDSLQILRGNHGSVYVLHRIG